MDNEGLCTKSLVFAQLGFLIPAESFSFTPAQHFEALFSAGEQEDRSRFEQEARIMQDILKNADENTVVFMNEPYTSTAAQEAVSMLLEAFLALHQKGSRQIVVTHYYELYTPLCEHLEQAVLSFTAKSIVSKDGIRHLYRMAQCPPDASSYASLIAKQYGIAVDLLIQNKEVAEQANILLQEMRKRMREETTMKC